MVMIMMMLTIMMELMVLLWQGYFAGGAGYVLSLAAVKRLVEVEENYKKNQSCYNIPRIVKTEIAPNSKFIWCFTQSTKIFLFWFSDVSTIEMNIGQQWQ